jgi:pimeloyl-ACP methyl ester carboxylesterase
VTDRHFLVANGIRLRFIESGQGIPVVFLHGFPDFSYSWRHQFPALSSAGFRCIAPDLRGYHESDKPPRVQDYAIPELVRDVVGLIDQTAPGGAHLIGHDWGGIIAWYLAMLEPARVRKLVIINAPHPALYGRELRSGRQLLRSWYAFFFQLPVLPELLLSSFHFALLKRGAARNAEEREIYEEALSQPGAPTAALNYYRAAFRALLTGRQPAAGRSITAPTLVLWGERDRALGPQLLDGLERFVENLQIIRFADIGHWAHIDAAERVNEELLRFL